MHPSYQMLLGNAHEGMSDEEFVHNELRLAELAEPLGFSMIGSVEHHFDREYSMMPDNFVVLTYLAARTKSIRLATRGVILPWNDPLRVAEKICLLDILSNGRLDIGFGRGLSRSEYGQFGIDMGEARDRWKEAMDMILGALETGVAQGDGPFYPQPAATVVPRTPGRPWRERLTEIAMSQDSVTIAAEYGARMATFVQFPIEQHKPLIDHFYATYEEAHGKPAPPVELCELMVCHEDPDTAKELAFKHIGRYFAELMRHYELADKEHFANTKGYESYAAVADLFKETGMEAAAEAYITANTWGTPEEILGKLEERRAIIGEYDLHSCWSYGGIPFEDAERGMTLFSQKVMPELRKMGTTSAVA